MLIKTRGIVLRTIKYSETSLIVEVFTEEKGLQKYIVSGVRTARAQVKASLLQVMSLLDLVAYHREGRDLHRLRELRPAFVYQAVPFELRRGAVGMFMVELARKTIRETEENRDLFGFLYHSFCYLDRTPHPVSNHHLHFMLALSSYLGFAPGGGYSPETPFFDLKEGVFVADLPTHPYSLTEDHSRRLSDLLRVERNESHTVPLNGPQRRALLLHLIDFYRLHIEHLPDIHSHDILQEVLE